MIMYLSTYITLPILICIYIYIDPHANLAAHRTVHRGAYIWTQQDRTVVNLPGLGGCCVLKEVSQNKHLGVQLVPRAVQVTSFALK